MNGNAVPFLTQESDVAFVLFPANLTSTHSEVEIATRLTQGYNAYLRRKATDHSSRITLVDVNGLLTELKDGKIPGLSGRHPLVDPAGSAFRLDGIHPNNKGYVQVANLFLNAINQALHKKYRKIPVHCGSGKA